MAEIRSICVFCGSAVGKTPAWAAAASDFGSHMAQRGLRLVYGGSRQGLMGALADAAIAGGAEAIGVMPRHLVAREVAHRGLTQLEMVETMAERKAMMIELADAFVALPGGYGTLDELSEVLTGQQLQLLNKPVGVLNLDGYYDSLLRFFDHATDVGFIRVRSRARLLTATTARELLNALEAY